MTAPKDAELVLGLDQVQVAIPADEHAVKQARWFYGEVLGLRELPKPDALVGCGGMWYQTGDLALHIGLDPAYRPATKAHPALLVRDLEALRARLEQAGCAVQSDVQIPGYRRCETRDPSGNRIELMERLPRATADAASTQELDEAKARVREQFTRTAQAYVVSRQHAQGRDLTRLVELAAPRSTDLALDISTGGGHTALALAPYVTRIIASDLTPTMLAAARQFLTERGVSNSDYVIADAERLPFLPATFDLVTVRIAPHHYTDVRAAIYEMARVLRPSGRLILIDNVAPEAPALDAFMNDIERRRDPSHVRNYTVSEWHALLAAAGLDVTHSERDRKTHDFAEWTGRAQMDDAARAALECDILAAPAFAREHFAIAERDGQVVSWVSDVLILRAIHPDR